VSHRRRVMRSLLSQENKWRRPVTNYLVKHFLQLCRGGPIPRVLAPRLLHRTRDRLLSRKPRDGWAIAIYDTLHPVVDAVPRLVVYIQDFPANYAKPVDERARNRGLWLLLVQSTTSTNGPEVDGLGMSKADFGSFVTRRIFLLPLEGFRCGNSAPQHQSLPPFLA